MKEIKLSTTLENIHNRLRNIFRIVLGKPIPIILNSTYKLSSVLAMDAYGCEDLEPSMEPITLEEDPFNPLFDPTLSLSSSSGFLK